MPSTGVVGAVAAKIQKEMGVGSRQDRPQGCSGQARLFVDLERREPIAGG